MPVTYNGIGTHYYGKRNLESRVGACHSCGRQGTLTSYNTTLWFVVAFIPVIPLGRKRIIDYCPACRRHYVVELKKWETAKQLEVSAALDKYRSAPSHENAIAVHQQLLKFHQTAQADEFQKELLQKFGQQAIVHCYLGAALEHRGLHSQAEPLFAKALELRPDLPQARAGVAMKLIRDRRLTEATDLLDFLDKPGSAQLYSLEPLEFLGDALQKSGDHQNALQKYERILKEIPPAGQHKAFRKKVKQSEKALRRTGTIFPKAKFSWRRFLGAERNSSGRSGPLLTRRGLVVAGGVAVAIAVVMIFANAHIRTHRKVFFLNGLSEVETLVIDGEKKLSLRPNRPQEQIMAEGAHTVQVKAPIIKTINFDIKSKSYFSRWFDNPVWIVNPDAGACLLYEEATYSKNPQPPKNHYFFGRESYFFSDVSHPFISLPASVTVNSDTESRTLQHVEPVIAAVEAFEDLRNNKRVAEAMQLAETRLPVIPGDEELLHAYVEELKTEKDATRGRKLLEPGLSMRPVRTEWHRAYQDLSRSEHRDELIGLYDGFLEKDPTNSTLLYLRGRIDKDAAKAKEFFNKAIAMDPQNALAYYALAYKFWNAGDWPEAKPLLARAVEIRPADAAFWKMYNLSRIGSGDVESLEKDLRDRLAKNPVDALSAIQLLELFAAQSRPADAQLLITTFMATARKKEPRAAPSLESYMRGHFLYASGQFAELERLSSKDQSPIGSAHLFQALLEQGKILEAEKLRASGRSKDQDPLELLTFSLASRLAGDDAKSKQSFDLALKAFQQSPGDFKIAGVLLASAQPPTDSQIAALSIPPQNKALLAAILQFQHPAESARFSQLARRLNLERGFPYHLIERSAAAK
jgi:tetratricopeptide (TPR) repeat protein